MLWESPHVQTRFIDKISQTASCTIIVSEAFLSLTHRTSSVFASMHHRQGLAVSLHKLSYLHKPHHQTDFQLYDSCTAYEVLEVSFLCSQILHNTCDYFYLYLEVVNMVQTRPSGLVLIQQQQATKKRKLSLSKKLSKDCT